MFNDVIVGVGDYEAGRDAVALARELAASGRPLTLAYVEVVGPKRVPRSEAAWPEANCRRARKWLALLGDELRVDAEPVCVESHSVAKGLRTLAATPQRRRASRHGRGRGVLGPPVPGVALQHRIDRGPERDGHAAGPRNRQTSSPGGLTAAGRQRCVDA